MPGITFEILVFCADECERQLNCGPLDMLHMVEAHLWMMQQTEPITEEMILHLARLIEPNAEISGYRKIPVITRSMSAGENPRLIAEQMTKLMIAGPDMRPEEFYQRFEEIHPFIDGNGRIGAILYNYLTSSLDTPQTAPQFIMRRL